MKLLLDENLSRRLVPFLLTAYPESTQVVLVGLEAADDARVWDYAKANDFVIVTQDADFEELSLVKGHPPSVIWIKTTHPSRRPAQLTTRVICCNDHQPATAIGILITYQTEETSHARPPLIFRSWHCRRIRPHFLFRVVSSGPQLWPSHFAQRWL